MSSSAITALRDTWVRPEIRQLSSYHVASAEGMIKLDAMENPCRWPAAMVAEWQAQLVDVAINRYPDPAATLLNLELRQSLKLSEGQSLILGNGSDELIQLLALLVAAPGRTLLAPEPGFVMYRMIASFVGLNYIGVPLQADFSLNLPAMLEAIDTQQPALIFLAYPNNPTGNLFNDSDIEAIIQHAPGLVVLDEAYHPFAQQSWVNRLGDYPNLLLMRTLSKLGLAGLRVGLLAGDDGWIHELDKLRLPYNINVLSQITARFALQHQALFDAQTAMLREERSQLQAALTEIHGLTPYPSAANFILCRTAPDQATPLFNHLKAAKILIKNLSPAGGLLSDCLRITVGLPEENLALLQAIRSFRFNA
ncbi:MAG: histidinol-phosphate transaminase [Gammaproteobacteria bacterium]|nr:histidinol-phosphate transaminase [Gammaproteobacteria bacterium]